MANATIDKTDLPNTNPGLMSLTDSEIIVG